MNTAMMNVNQKLSKTKDLIEKSRGAILKLIPKHVDAEKMIKLAHVSLTKNPALLECDPMSVVKSIVVLSQLGLEFDSPLGAAYLVPYKSKAGMQCQPIIGYRGMVELARRSGQIKSITAQVVYSDDQFEVVQGTEEKLRHVPSFTADRNDRNIVCAYAIAHFVEGGYQFEVMTKPQIDAIRNRSKAGQFGPWATDYAEMARKTVIRRLAKYLPLSPELARGVSIDEASDSGKVISSFVEDGEVIFADDDVEIQVDVPAAASKGSRTEAQIIAEITKDA